MGRDRERSITESELTIMGENIGLRLEANLNKILNESSKELEKKLDDKLSKFSDDFGKANDARRDSSILLATGYSWEDRTKLRKVIQHATKNYEGSTETKKQIKKALVGYGTTVTMGGVIGWLINHFIKS